MNMHPKLWSAWCQCCYSIMDIYTCATYRFLNQPKNFQFPQHSFGVKKPEQRSFQPSWFNSRLWLYYVICACWLVYKEICTSKSKQLIHFDGYSTEKTFITFCISFWKYESLKCHQVIRVLIVKPAWTCRWNNVKEACRIVAVWKRFCHEFSFLRVKEYLFEWKFVTKTIEIWSKVPNSSV